MLLLYFIISFILALSIYFYRHKNVADYLFSAFLLLNLGFNVYSFLHLNSTDLVYFTYDSLGLLLQSVLTVLSFSTFYFSRIYLEKDSNLKHRSIYYFCLLMLIVGMNGVYFANDVTVLWILIEATTLSVAMLIYHERNALSLEATWKYVFVCSTGIALAYTGILFLSALLQTGGNELDLSFVNLTKSLANANPVFMKISFIFIFVGYATKMGLFPMHTVTIDAHSIAPPPISAMISTALMNVGFVGIFRIYSIFHGNGIDLWMNNILIISGFLSILTSTAYMMKVTHVKRMLAYSSLENMGIVAIGIGIGGYGYYAAILHLMLHSFVKAGLFYNVMRISKLYGTYSIGAIHDYGAKDRLYGYFFLLLIVMLLAIPPSGLFMSKFFILQSIIMQGNYLLFGLICFLLCFLLYNLINKSFNIVFGHADTALSKEDLKFDTGFFVQLALVLIVVYIGIIRPPLLDNLINNAIGGLIN